LPALNVSSVGSNKKSSSVPRKNSINSHRNPKEVLAEFYENMEKEQKTKIDQ